MSLRLAVALAGACLVATATWAGSGQVGWAGSMVVASMAPDGRWILPCQVDTGDDRLFARLDPAGYSNDPHLRLVDAHGAPIPLRVDEAVARDSAGRYLVVRQGSDLVLYDGETRALWVLGPSRWTNPEFDGLPIASFDAAGSAVLFARGRQFVRRDLTTGEERAYDTGGVGVLDPGGAWVWVWPDDGFPHRFDPGRGCQCCPPVGPVDGGYLPTEVAGASLVSVKRSTRMDAATVVAAVGPALLRRGADGALLRWEGGVEEPLLDRACEARLQHVDVGSGQVVVSCPGEAGHDLVQVRDGMSRVLTTVAALSPGDHYRTTRYLSVSDTVIDTRTATVLAARGRAIVGDGRYVLWLTPAMTVVWDDRATGRLRADPRGVGWPAGVAGTWAVFPSADGRRSIVWDVATGSVREVVGYPLGVTSAGRALLGATGLLTTYPPLAPAWWDEPPVPSMP